MKPPQFAECSVCGREFGSKSILIHEPQCLQKLRRTEIDSQNQQSTHNKKHRRRKKPPEIQSSPISPPSNNMLSVASSTVSIAASRSNSPKKGFVLLATNNGGGRSDSNSFAAKVNFPRIPFNSSATSATFNSKNRPTTAVLDKPRVLNPEYIQYDMSLTRIDFTGTVPAITDENRNHRQSQRPLTQKLDTGTSFRHGAILPTVDIINATSGKVVSERHSYKFTEACSTSSGSGDLQARKAMKIVATSDGRQSYPPAFQNGLYRTRSTSPASSAFFCNASHSPAGLPADRKTDDGSTSGTTWVRRPRAASSEDLISRLPGLPFQEASSLDKLIINEINVHSFVAGLQEAPPAESGVSVQLTSEELISKITSNGWVGEPSMKPVMYSKPSSILSNPESYITADSESEVYGTAPEYSEEEFELTVNEPACRQDSSNGNVVLNLPNVSQESSHVLTASFTTASAMGNESRTEFGIDQTRANNPLLSHVPFQAWPKDETRERVEEAGEEENQMVERVVYSAPVATTVADSSSSDNDVKLLLNIETKDSCCSSSNSSREELVNGFVASTPSFAETVVCVKSNASNELSSGGSDGQRNVPMDCGEMAGGLGQPAPVRLSFRAGRQQTRRKHKLRRSPRKRSPSTSTGSDADDEGQQRISSWSVGRYPRKRLSLPRISSFKSLPASSNVGSGPLAKLPVLASSSNMDPEDSTKTDQPRPECILPKVQQLEGLKKEVVSSANSGFEMPVLKTTNPSCHNERKNESGIEIPSIPEDAKLLRSLGPSVSEMKLPEALIYKEMEITEETVSEEDNLKVGAKHCVSLKRAPCSTSEDLPHEEGRIYASEELQLQSEKALNELIVNDGKLELPSEEPPMLELTPTPRCSKSSFDSDTKLVENDASLEKKLKSAEQPQSVSPSNFNKDQNLPTASRQVLKQNCCASLSVLGESHPRRVLTELYGLRDLANASKPQSCKASPLTDQNNNHRPQPTATEAKQFLRKLTAKSRSSLEEQLEMIVKDRELPSKEKKHVSFQLPEISTSSEEVGSDGMDQENRTIQSNRVMDASFLFSGTKATREQKLANAAGNLLKVAQQTFDDYERNIRKNLLGSPGSDSSTTDTGKEQDSKAMFFKAFRQQEIQNAEDRDRAFDHRKHVNNPRNSNASGNLLRSMESAAIITKTESARSQPADVKVIIRRSNKEGLFPQIDSIISSWSSDTTYLIVDEVPITSTSPNHYKLAHSTVLGTDSTKHLLEDLPLKITTSNASSIANLPLEEAQKRHLTCYICGFSFSADEYQEHERQCTKLVAFQNRNLHADEQRVLPEKPKGTITISQWNAFARKHLKNKIIHCPYCGMEFLADEKEEIERHTLTCVNAPPPERSKNSKEIEPTLNISVAVAEDAAGRVLPTKHALRKLKAAVPADATGYDVYKQRPRSPPQIKFEANQE